MLVKKYGLSSLTHKFYNYVLCTAETFTFIKLVTAWDVEGFQVTVLSSASKEQPNYRLPGSDL